MTDGSPPKSSPVKEAVKAIKLLPPDNELASGRYRQTLEFIDESSTIRQSRRHIERITKNSSTTGKNFDNAMRAAICSQLHSKPSVPHLPRHSIKVTTLQNLSPPYIRRFLCRLPMLLRLLLSPLSYFHPVNITSITATASGRWIETMLVQNIFKDYGRSRHRAFTSKTAHLLLALRRQFRHRARGNRRVGSSPVPALLRYQLSNIF